MTGLPISYDSIEIHRRAGDASGNATVHARQFEDWPGRLSRCALRALEGLLCHWLPSRGRSGNQPHQALESMRDRA